LATGAIGDAYAEDNKRKKHWKITLKLLG
jgi:hypothetical protein